MTLKIQQQLHKHHSALVWGRKLINLRFELAKQNEPAPKTQISTRFTS